MIVAEEKSVESTTKGIDLPDIPESYHRHQNYDKENIKRWSKNFPEYLCKDIMNFLCKYFQIKQRSKHQLGSECSVELKHFAYFFVKGKTQGKGKKPNRHLTIECLNLFLLYKSGNSSTS